MTTPRLIAWAEELQAVHDTLRRALDLAREAVTSGADPASAVRDLLVYCVGFCAALDGHHSSEDHVLFPELEQARPDLAPVLAKLRSDHSMLNHLIGSFEKAVRAGSPTPDLLRHLDGIGALMESHFSYEERELLGVLATAELSDSVRPQEALGDLAAR